MPFRKGLSKYLKNITYKHNPANRLVENSCYMLCSYILTPTRRDNSFKPIITPRITKDI